MAALDCEGAARAGRPANDVELVQTVLISISDDRELARREVAQQIGFYAPRGPMNRSWPSMARGVAPELRRAYADRDLDRLSSLVTDEMAETYALYGPADEVVDKAKRFEGWRTNSCSGGRGGASTRPAPGDHWRSWRPSAAESGPGGTPAGPGYFSWSFWCFWRRGKISAGEATRSRMRIPSRWSTSCWMALASNPDVSALTSSPPA